MASTAQAHIPTWAYRAESPPIKSSLVFPGDLGGINWGGVAWDPNSGYAFVVSQDVGALGWMEKTREGASAQSRRRPASSYGPPDSTGGPTPTQSHIKAGTASSRSRLWPAIR